MADIKQLKLKINSTKSIKKITNAMEIISTLKFQKVKKNAENLREYMTTFLGMLSAINGYADIFPKPSTTAERELAILITSEKWLCGSLNTLLFKAFEEQVKDKKDNLDVYVIGKKGVEYCRRHEYTIIGESHLSDEFRSDELTDLYALLGEAQINDKYRNITVWYNFFKNTMRQIPTGFQVFPLESSAFEKFMRSLEIELPKQDYMQDTNYMKLEPDRATIIKKSYDILRDIIVYGAVLHNKTGEFAARMLAMKWAKDNATEIIDDLTLEFNKARQDAITQEVLEIVSAKAVLDD